MSPLTETPMFNPLEAGYMENPYPHFAEMRDGQPVHLSMMDVWVLFDHDDVFRLLRDPTMSVMDAKIEVRDEERYAEMLEAAGGELEQDSSMLNTDPPDHTRLRRLVSKAFTPAAIQALRPRIQELVDAALDELAAAGTGDIVKQLAFPLPFDVISEMLGMPESDKDQIAAWSGTIVKSLDPMLALDSFAEIRAASNAMNAHIDEVIRWKRENPGDDLLTALIAAEEGGDRLTPGELRDQVNLLFIAGHETTVNLIGTGIYELLRHPEQAAIWRADPELDATAVDEMLRFVSPVQFSTSNFRARPSPRACLSLPGWHRPIMTRKSGARPPKNLMCAAMVPVSTCHSAAVPTIASVRRWRSSKQRLRSARSCDASPTRQCRGTSSGTVASTCVVSNICPSPSDLLTR